MFHYQWSFYNFKKANTIKVRIHPGVRACTRDIMSLYEPSFLIQRLQMRTSLLVRCDVKNFPLFNFLCIWIHTLINWVYQTTVLLCHISCIKGYIMQLFMCAFVLFCSRICMHIFWWHCLNNNMHLLWQLWLANKDCCRREMYSSTAWGADTAW